MSKSLALPYAECKLQLAGSQDEPQRSHVFFFMLEMCVLFSAWARQHCPAPCATPGRASLIVDGMSVLTH
jgi:hypothetical protein